MKQRFQFSFFDVEKKMLKTFKGLKSKKKYSLSQAESMISYISKQILVPVTLKLCCEDTENDVTYLFESITVMPNDEEKNEMVVLKNIENQLLESDVLNVHRLIMAIHNQYREEIEINENSLEKLADENKKSIFRNRFRWMN